MKNSPSLSRPPVGNDNERNSSPSLLGDLLMGLRFFSRLPTGNSPHEKPDLNRIVPALGLTSVVIGIGPALVLVICIWLGMPTLLGVCFAIAAQILVTGAMAEDGLADSFDGLWGGHTPEHRLDIMKDSTHGTYGVLALILLIAVRLFTLSTLMLNSITGAALLWIAAQVIARQSALWIALTLPPAREGGTARAAGTLSRKAFIVGAVISVLILIIFAGMFIGVFGIIITAAIVVLIISLWLRFCKNLVGGYSGDLIGALQTLVEIGALSTFIVFI